jgi:hypothetical protein
MRNVPPIRCLLCQPRTARAGRLAAQPEFVFLPTATASCTVNLYFLKSAGADGLRKSVTPRGWTWPRSPGPGSVHAIWLAQTGQSLQDYLQNCSKLGVYRDLPRLPSVLSR